MDTKKDLYISCCTWIAENDEPECFDPAIIINQTSVRLVADNFDMQVTDVAVDVVCVRTERAIENEKHS